MSEEKELQATGASPANRTPEVIAAEINMIVMQARAYMLNVVIQLGKRLAEVKGAIGHGNWGEWCEKNLDDIDQRTASNYIKIYEEYGIGQENLFSKPLNSQTLAKITYTKGIALLAIKDPDEREKFMEDHNVPDMSTRELQKALKERDEALQQQKEAEEKAKAAEEKEKVLSKELAEAEEKQKNALRENQERIDQLRKQKENTVNQLHAANKIEEDLLKQIKELKEKDQGGVVDDKRAHELEVKLAAAKGKIKDLEVQLGKPIETVPVVPLETQAEIERLKEELEKIKAEPPKDSESEGRREEEQLRIIIKDIQGKFNDAMETVDNMPAGTRQRFRKAVAKLLEVMQEKAMKWDA